MITRRRHQPRLLEADFQIQVTELAERLGWTWVHFPTVKTVRRNRDGSERFVNETPYQGPLGRGWPDLVLVRERTIYVELKSSTGRPSGAQTLVLGQLREAGCEVYLWTPDDFHEVQRVLSRRLTAKSGPAVEKHPGPGNTHPDQEGIA